MAFDVLLSTVLGIPEKKTRDPGIGTWHPCIGPGTQDPPPGTLHLGPAVRDLHMEPGTRDTKCGTLIKTEYVETSPLICSDYFLYDGDLRHERVD